MARSPRDAATQRGVPGADQAILLAGSRRVCRAGGVWRDDSRMTDLESAKRSGMPETSPRPEGEQARLVLRAAPRWTAADVLTALRLPMAVAFVLAPSAAVRIVLLALAAATDLLDGWLARQLGGSRLGAFLDPVAD